MLLQPKDTVLLILTLSASKQETRSLKGLTSLVGGGNRGTDSRNPQIGLRRGKAVHSKPETSIICS